MDCDVLFTPTEFQALSAAQLANTTCVVFDILRATTSIVTALANGACAIFPVREIADAVQLRARHPDALLAGERHGRRILAGQTGGIDFDFGNSPREFTPIRVSSRKIIMTTTNGTRALQACGGATHVFAGAFLNLSALAASVQKIAPPRLLIICAGTFDQAAYEDALAAGALCDLLWDNFNPETLGDSAQITRQLWLAAQPNLAQSILHARNALRLLSIPELSADVPFCLQRDTVKIVPELGKNGELIASLANT